MLGREHTDGKSILRITKKKRISGWWKRTTYTGETIPWTLLFLGSCAHVDHATA